MAKKASLRVLVCALFALCQFRVSAFVGLQANIGTRHIARFHGGMRMAVEELEQLNPAIKGRRLDVVDAAEGICKYEFEIEAPGPRTQSLHHRIMREIKNKSDFPGYRKGEIPPQLMPEANKYVVEEIMNDCLDTALDTYGLVGAKGEGSEAEIKTDMAEMLQAFKPGKPLQFTCTFDAKPKPVTDNEPVTEDATPAD